MIPFWLSVRRSEQGGRDLQPAWRVLREFCGGTGDGKDLGPGVQYDFVGDAQFCCVDAAWKEFENGFGRDAAEYPGKVFCTDSEAAHCLSEGRT